MAEKVVLGDIHEAVAELKRHPEAPIEAEIDGVVVELRYRRERTAADIFREVGPWEGESADELIRIIRKGRDAGGSRDVPQL